MPGCVRAQIHEFLFVIFFDFFGITAHGQQKDAVRCIWEFLLRVSYSNKITSYASFRRMFSSEKPRRAYSRSISRATAAINASISASVFRMGGRVYHTICMEKNIQTNKITCPPRSLRRPGGLRRLCDQGSVCAAFSKNFAMLNFSFSDASRAAVSPHLSTSFNGMPIRTKYLTAASSSISTA